MNKVVINTCYGGFSLSLKGQQLLAQKMGIELFFYKQTKYRHEHGVVEYTKVNIDETNMWATSLTKDFGDVVTGELDWEYYFDSREVERHSPLLVEVVEELGEEANGSCADLTVVEISGSAYRIDEYDGSESLITPDDDMGWVYIK